MLLICSEEFNVFIEVRGSLFPSPGKDGFNDHRSVSLFKAK